MMKTYTIYICQFSLLLIFLSLNSIHGYAQFTVKVKKKEFKKEEYGFKEAWISVKEGYKHYEKGEGAYREARTSFLKAYEYNKDNAELNYMIGKCYLFTDDKYESINYIQKAFELDNEVNFDIHFLLGMAFHQILEFDNAIDEYNLFLKNLSSKYKDKYNAQVQQLIIQCRNGREIVKNPTRVVVNNLGKAVNSVFDEYAPVLTSTQNKLYFTSRRKYEKKSTRSEIDFKFFEDIYYSQLQDKNWSRARRMDDQVTNKKNTTNIAVVGISHDDTRIYIYNGNSNDGDLYVTEFKKDKWSNPKSLKKFNTKAREISFCLSSNENTLYYVSSSEKNGIGGSDIWISKKNSKGNWSKPQNLGSVINSPYDEIGVSLSANDSVLYFSSKGHNSMGGYDVFKSKLNDVGMWSKPENLGYPVNTPNDDIFYHEMLDGKTAYYSTIRESGIGGFDIYKLIFLGSEKEMSIADVAQPIIGVFEPKPGIYFEPSVKLAIDTSLVMRGIITDSENQTPISAKIELIDQQRSTVIATAISDSTGNYVIHLPLAKEYGIELVAKGYLLFLDKVDLSSQTYDEVFVKDFQLDRVEVGAKVILQNIYFEVSKSTLKEESFTTLDAVVRLMQNNPTLKLEISGHTDNVGTAKYNKKLSGERAKACVDYLVKQGIAADRFTYVGEGFNFSIFPNDTEEGRAKNRRVEFKVLSK